MHSKISLIAFTLTLTFAPAAWGLACLTPTGTIVAEVIPLGPNPGGLEQVEIRIDGFELAGPFASDFSYTDSPSGQTWLYWTSFPLVTPIELVIEGVVP